MPTVSVIMPCYNSSEFLQESVESILSQTYSDLELIIVDDSSTDCSYDIVKRLSAIDSRVVGYRMMVNSGAAICRNKAIEVARGRFIAFCDSDDLWYPTKLDLQINMMCAENVGFSWCSYDVINHSGAFIRRQSAKKSISYIDLLKKNGVIGCVSAVYDTGLYGKQFLPVIKMRQDYGLWLKLLRISENAGIRVRGCEKTLAKYRIHPNNLTRNKLLAGFYQYKLYRDVEEISAARSLAYFASYLVNGITDRL